MSQAGSLNDTFTPSNPITFHTDAGDATAVANILNVSGGANITTSAAGNTILVTFTGSTGLTWQPVTSAFPINPIQIVANNGYICNGANLVTFLLPLAPALGDTFVILSNTSRFQINQNGGQQVCVGTSSSSVGIGNCASNSAGDQVEFVYVGGNIFRGFAPQGVVTLN